MMRLSSTRLTPLFSVLLIGFLLSPLFISCSSAADTPSKSTTETSSVSQKKTSPAPKAPTARSAAALPDSAKTKPSAKPTSNPITKPASPTNPAVPRLEEKTFPQGTLYSLLVPAKSPFKVLPVQSKMLAGVDSPVWKTLSSSAKPLFVINGGYFDPANQLTTSYIFKDGVITGDPKLNTHLTGNPKLVPYLPKIYNRSEFRVYLCHSKRGPFVTRYDIVPHNAPIPGDCLLQDSLGAGPSLLPKITDYEEGFVDYNAQHKLIRDPIGVSARNARSAVGLSDKGDVIFLMGAQDPTNLKSSGFSLMDIAALMKARGAVKAISLDGGSSSGFFYQGKAVYGKFNADGAPVKRPVKSVIVVIPR
jgi:hypothetical protein